MKTKKPQFGKTGLGPFWWHSHGIKVKMQKRSGNAGPIEFTSGAASLRISESLKITRGAGGGYLVDWQIKNSLSVGVSGSVFFTEKELRQAFGLTDEITESEGGLLEEFGGTTASVGTFIRYKEWLNVPCPGTGRDGDPNISLKIDDEIKKEIERFINGKP